MLLLGVEKGEVLRQYTDERVNMEVEEVTKKFNKMIGELDFKVDQLR